jgi:protein SCO1
MAIQPNGHRRRAPALLAALSLCTILVACQSSPRHYGLRGRVLDRNADQVTVSHGEIPDFMPAMTMVYPVKNSPSLGKVQAGDSITADLMVDGSKNYWLEHLVITGTGGLESRVATASRELEAGEKIPDVRLMNQDGKAIRLSEFKGKSVLVTFIYTRCPFPTFCPLLSNEFAAIRRELIKTPDVYKKTHLVSISLDPAYDTPPVLRKYGLGYVQNDAAGFAYWDFVATSPGDLRELATAFGLEYFEQGNQITHSMRTVLLAPDGTVAKIWPGNAWRKTEILDTMRNAAMSK